ncbi:MAG: T9SS type A sorting domain-containing protein [Bacteroidetes bacterium]|nr:T9SS type A sorting domain-containing protein [Bacteroidota bacterium]
MKTILLFCSVFLVTHISIFGQTENVSGNPERNQYLLPSGPASPLLPPLCGSYNVGTGQTYTTLTAAISALNSWGVSCAVSFILTDNTYPSETFPITINAIAGTSFTSTVTIKPGAGKTPVITGSSASAILLLNGAKYIIIDGSNSGGSDKSLTWANTSIAANTYTIEFTNNGTVGASNDLVKNCLIRASSQITKNTYGIFLDNTGGAYDSITISNNTIYSARVGIQFQGVAGSLATNGQIINNIIGSTTDAQAIQFKGIFLRLSDNTLIQGNEIMGAPAGNANTAQAGVWVPANVQNTRILQNKIHDWYYTGTGGFGNYGIYYSAGAATPTEISNNAITNIKADGDNASQDWMVAGIYINGGGNIRVFHNSVWLTGATLQPTYNGWSACLSIYSGVAALNVRDNIFKNSMTLASGTTGNTYAVYCASASTAFGNINYNDYYDNGVNPNIGYLGGNQATLAAWQTATGQDANSLNIDPLFTGPNDLHTTVAGLAKTGVYLALVPVDITGAGRTNPPDIGAYQFSANPVAVTTPATGITLTSATLNGTISPNNATVTTGFDWGTTIAYGNYVAGIPLTVNGTIVMAIAGFISGLTPCTIYHFRIKGTSGGVVVNGLDMTWTPANAAPITATTAASLIASTTATLNGTVNANTLSTTTSFDYGLTIAYGTNIPGVPLTVTGNTATGVLANITGLLPGTLYHYRVNGTNVCGTTNGTDMTFTTLPPGPIVVTLPATGIGGTSATLNGTVNANSNSTTVVFNYGLTIAYGSTIPGVPSPVTGNSPTTVSASLTGLLTNTTYHFRVCGTNVAGSNCGTDLTFFTGCTAAGSAGPVTGPISVCQGGAGYVYTVAPIPNASGYNWTVPVGGTITAGVNTNSITVSYSPSAVSGYIYIYGTSLCGNGSPSQLLVTVNPSATPTLIGPANVCVNSTGNVYTTQSGMTGYVWTVSAGGIITAGNGTNSITVTWTTIGAKTVCVNYNNAAGCPALTPGCYNVTVNPLPVPTVTGPNPACTGIPGITYSTQAGMTNYIWSISAGGTITGGSTTNTITVLWNTAGAQTISVNYTNTNGCTPTGPAVYLVTVNATTVPVITGTSDLCINSGYYNYTTQAAMTNYIWTVSAGGTITNGMGTNVLQVVWPNVGAQTVSVIFTNPTGCTPTAPTVLPVIVDGLPDAAGTITGTAYVCTGTNDVAYSVPPVNNAITYIWSLPTGATIASGAGTNSITVDFASNASSGDIIVSGNNICGNGTPSPNLFVTVTPIPPAPVINLLILDTLISDAPAGNQWYLDGVLIPGATSQYYIPTQSGHYTDIVTINGCISAESNEIYVIFEDGIESHGNGYTVSVYPNPGKGLFTLAISTNEQIKFDLSVVNCLGVTIYQQKGLSIQGNGSKSLDLQSYPDGVYSIVLQNNNNHILKKIVINR